MFHAVNGDSLGNARMAPGMLPADAEPQTPNKGDRGYSDQAEATIFWIGNTGRERTRR